jgi:hypothetical protein
VQYFNATRSEMIAVVGSDEVDALLSRSVVLIGVGGNDLSSFANAPKRPPPEDVSAFFDSRLMPSYSAAIKVYTAALLIAGLITETKQLITDRIIHAGRLQLMYDRYKNHIILFQDLYTLGARKFAVINVGLDGCQPAARVLDAVGSCSDYRNYLANLFDGALQSLLTDLAKRLPDFHYSLADSFALMVKTFFDQQTSASSGFTDVASACCGGGRLGAEAECSLSSTICADRDSHYFWDAVHITQQAAKQRADAFYDDVPAKYTTPINFKQLVNMTAA